MNQMSQLAFTQHKVHNKSFDANVTLWEFLLELLLDENSQELISWTNYDGEFRLHKSEEVARLWGLRKKRNNMNYDKLSRALRYYYDKNIIQKVAGKKFVYQFVTFPENFSKSSIILPPADFLKRINAMNMAGPSLPTMSPVSKAAAIRHAPSFPDDGLSQICVPTMNPYEQIRSSEPSRKRSRTHEMSLISNQKEQEEIQLQLKLLDMYNELINNPIFTSSNEVPFTFQQFVALTQSVCHQQLNQITTQMCSSAGSNDDSDFESRATSLTSSPLGNNGSNLPGLNNTSSSNEEPLDLTTKKFKLEPVDIDF